MKIVCTVKEFATLVRGCAETSGKFGCGYCPMRDICNDGVVEQFVDRSGIIDEAKEGLQDE